MYYQIEDDTRTFDSAEDVVDYLVTVDYFEEDEDGFYDYLNESEGNVEVCGYEWPAGDVLKEMSNDAYYRELHYWAENRADDSKTDYVYELERLSHGEYADICGYNVYAYEEADEDEDEDEAENATQLALELLEQKLSKEKEEKTIELTEQNKTADSFLSVLGIQVI